MTDLAWINLNPNKIILGKGKYADGGWVVLVRQPLARIIPLRRSPHLDLIQWKYKKHQLPEVRFISYGQIIINHLDNDK